MKKLSSYFLVVAFLATMSACASDGSSCKLDGNWKVKSADITSDKIDKSILEMAKGMTLATTYSFTADSITINSGPQSKFQGSYAVDATGKTLNWTTIGVGTMAPYNGTLKIVSCNGNEVTLMNRNPVDTTVAEITMTTMVLERVK